jgi:hypothetical protein
VRDTRVLRVDLRRVLTEIHSSVHARVGGTSLKTGGASTQLNVSATGPLLLRAPARAGSGPSAHAVKLYPRTAAPTDRQVYAEWHNTTFGAPPSPRSRSPGGVS